MGESFKDFGSLEYRAGGKAGERAGELNQNIS